jgi:hypothetical protein
MALRLPASSKITGRNQGNSNAQFAITPHRRSTIMVEKIRKINNWKLGRAYKAIYEQL